MLVLPVVFVVLGEFRPLFGLFVEASNATLFVHMASIIVCCVRVGQRNANYSADRACILLHIEVSFLCTIIVGSVAPSCLL